jgi:type IV pilus assembly protein PilW
MRARQDGFGMTEIMVGMGIGMLAMVVVMQVFSQSEGQKRSTTGGADAQSNGAIGLYMIERDVRMAGWGMDPALFGNCGTTFTYCDGSAACGGTAGELAGFSLASVVVADGGSQPDTVTAQFFANPNLDTFRYPGTTRLRSTMPQPSAELNVGSTDGCEAGDLVLVSQAGNCTLMQVTTVQGPALKIQHNPGNDGIYNPPANYQNSNGWPAYTTGASLSCFKAPASAALFQRSYAIDSALRQLQRDDNSVTPASVGEVVAPEIVDLQAEYGVTAGGASQTVNEWVEATGATWSAPDMEARKRIKAVRIALVARSTQYEKPGADGECTTTTPDMVAGWSSWAKFSTASYPADWKCYRYKVFETVVPLRNVLWGNL